MNVAAFLWPILDPCISLHLLAWFPKGVMSLPAAAVSAPAKSNQRNNTPNYFQIMHLHLQNFELACLGPTPKLDTLDILDVFAQKVVCQQVTSENLQNARENKSKSPDCRALYIFSKYTFTNERPH